MTVSLAQGQDKLAEIESLKQAVIVNPDDAGAYYKLGMAYFELGHYSLATEAFRQVIRIDPGNADAKEKLNSAMSGQKTEAEAIKAYNALVISPDNPDVHYSLGRYYASHNQRDSALKEYEILKELKPALAEELGKFLSVQEPASEKLPARPAQKVVSTSAESVDKVAVKAPPPVTPEVQENPEPDVSNIPEAKPVPTEIQQPAHRTDEKTALKTPLFSVQVGAFINHQNAEKLTDKLKNKGYDAFIKESPTTDNRTLHRVLVGRLNRKWKALELSKKLFRQEGMKSVIYYH